MKRAFAALAAALLLSSTATAEDRLVGVRPAENTPEAGLWAVSDKAEAEAKRSGDINTSVELRDYVSKVTCAVARAHCPEVRVRVFDRPFFNATMAPNGFIEVWSGLLLRADSEAELAFVLGHEAGHYVSNDQIESHKTEKARRTGTMVAAALVGIAATVAIGSAPTADAANSIADSTRGLIDALYLGMIASLFSYSREQETAADAFGAQAAIEAGYNPQAGAVLWQRKIEEAQASDFPAVRKAAVRSNIYNSHPIALDRVAALRKFAEARVGGEDGRERHRAAIRPFLGPWLKDDLRRRDFGQTLFLIERLAASGEDLGVLRYYRGEALRLRRKDGDAAAAEAAYREATQYTDAPAETWRQLADFTDRRGEHAETARLLQTFLDKAPNAPDAGLARMRLDRANGLSPASPQSTPQPKTPAPEAPAATPAAPPLVATATGSPPSTSTGLAP